MAVNDAQQVLAYASITKKSPLNKRLVRVTLAILFFGFGVMLAVLTRQNNKDNTATVTPPATAPQDATQNPAPSPTPIPTPTTAPQPKTYTDTAWGISFTPPPDWQIQTKEVSATTKLFYNAFSNQTYGQIDRYEINPETTLSSIEEQLRLSPETKNIQHTTASDIPALKLTARSNTQLLIVLKDQYLFYISGRMATNKAIKLN